MFEVFRRLKIKPALVSQQAALWCCGARELGRAFRRDYGGSLSPLRAGLWPSLTSSRTNERPLEEPRGVRGDGRGNVQGDAVFMARGGNLFDAVLEVLFTVECGLFEVRGDDAHEHGPAVEMFT